MRAVDKLLPFYNYGQALAGPFDPERLQPEDVWPATTPEQAATKLANYMVDWAGDGRWQEPERLRALATLIAEARHCYWHGHYVGDVVSTLAQDEGLLLGQDAEDRRAQRLDAPLMGVPKDDWRHHDGYRDWLWKVAEPGTRDRPYDDLRDVHDPEQPDDWVPHDYSEFDDGDDWFAGEWPAAREHLFAKPPVSDAAAGQQARRRGKGLGTEPEKPRRKKRQATQPKYGVLTHYLGDFRPRRVGTAPFRSVWLLARNFYREQTGRGLNVNFMASHDKASGRLGRENASTGRLLGPDATWCTVFDSKRLNSASHFWAALCGKVDILLDLDAMEPDPALWHYIRSNTGLLPADDMTPSKDTLLIWERQRLLLIAERTERWARGAEQAPK